jgi:hypothetical protein
VIVTQRTIFYLIHSFLFYSLLSQNAHSFYPFSHPNLRLHNHLSSTLAPTVALSHTHYHNQLKHQLPHTPSTACLLHTSQIISFDCYLALKAVDSLTRRITYHFLTSTLQGQAPIKVLDLFIPLKTTHQLNPTSILQTPTSFRSSHRPHYRTEHSALSMTRSSLLHIKTRAQLLQDSRFVNISTGFEDLEVPNHIANISNPILRGSFICCNLPVLFSTSHLFALGTKICVQHSRIRRFRLSPSTSAKIQLAKTLTPRLAHSNIITSSPRSSIHLKKSFVSSSSSPLLTLSSISKK